MLTLQTAKQPDDSLLFLLLALSVDELLPGATLAATLPQSTLCCFLFKVRAAREAFIAHVSLTLTFFDIVASLPSSAIDAWLQVLQQLLQSPSRSPVSPVDEWNVKSLVPHHAFLNTLLLLLPEHSVIVSLLPLLLSSNCSSSLLTQLFSLLHASASFSLHTSLIQIFTSSLLLPPSPPELLLAEGTSIRLHTTDLKDSFSLPSTWCISMELRLFSDVGYSTVLSIADDANSPVDVVISRGFCTVMINHKSVVTPVPLTPTDLCARLLSLTHSNTVTLAMQAFASFSVNSTSTRVALPPISHPRVTLFHSSRPAILRSFSIASTPTATPWFRVTPSLLSNQILLNAETPNVVPKSALLSVRSLLSKDQESRIPELMAKIDGPFLVSKNEHISTAIQNLGGNSVLFPLLQKANLFSDSEKQAYIDYALSLFEVTMQNASSNDWLLFTECLSRWVRSDLQACLPAHVPALARCAKWSCLVDLFFHETLHASMPREWRGSLKAVLEAMCRCWYCTQVSEEVTKYDGYAEWCVERGRDLSAWLVERVSEHVETATAEELGALFRVLRKESEERRDCTALVDFVTAVMNTPGGVDRVMSGLACLSEYSECVCGYLTFWLALKGAGVAVDSLLNACVEACERQAKWSAMSVKPEHVMLCYHAMKQQGVVSGPPCPPLSHHRQPDIDVLARVRALSPHAHHHHSLPALRQLVRPALSAL